MLPLSEAASGVRTLAASLFGYPCVNVLIHVPDITREAAAEQFRCGAGVNEGLNSQNKRIVMTSEAD